MTGYRPVVLAREGRMLGIRQPRDGPIFEKLEDAQHWCIHAMISHYDRRLWMMSDARIEPFKGDGRLRASVESCEAEGHRADLCGGGEGTHKGEESSSAGRFD
jgi:hypothetical protein